MHKAARLICTLLLLMPVLSACKHHAKIYSSVCNDGHSFSPVSLKKIVDSLDFYNNKFVEVSGKFVQEKNMSVLTGDTKGLAIMIEFGNACPLFLTGTRIGFFDYDNNNGQLTPANNKMVKIRGELIVHLSTKLNQPKISVSHVSYVQF